MIKGLAAAILGGTVLLAIAGQTARTANMTADSRLTLKSAQIARTMSAWQTATTAWAASTHPAAGVISSAVVAPSPLLAFPSGMRLYTPDGATVCVFYLPQFRDPPATQIAVSLAVLLSRTWFAGTMTSQLYSSAAGDTGVAGTPCAGGDPNDGKTRTLRYQ